MHDPSLDGVFSIYLFLFYFILFVRIFFVWSVLGLQLSRLCYDYPLFYQTQIVVPNAPALVV